MKHILFATDFSPNAEAAQEQAVSIALNRGASLTVVHIIVPLASPTGFLPTPEPLLHGYQEAAQARLEGLVRRLSERVADVHSRVVHGQPQRGILEAAEEIDADLVVLGTRGLTGLKHLLLGSTAQRVIEHSERPVLTVPSVPEREGRPVERVLVPTDFSSDASAATAAAKWILSSRMPIKMVLLNVFYTPILYTAYGTVPISTHYLDDFRGESERALKDLAKSLRRAGLEVETLAEEGAPAEVILEVAERRGVDLIAMGTRGRSGLSHLLLGSTAARVVGHARCPVLTVSRKDD